MNSEENPARASPNNVAVYKLNDLRKPIERQKVVTNLKVSDSKFKLSTLELVCGPFYRTRNTRAYSLLKEYLIGMISIEGILSDMRYMALMKEILLSEEQRAEVERNLKMPLKIIYKDDVVGI